MASTLKIFEVKKWYTSAGFGRFRGLPISGNVSNPLKTAKSQKLAATSSSMMWGNRSTSFKTKWEYGKRCLVKLGDTHTQDHTFKFSGWYWHLVLADFLNELLLSGKRKIGFADGFLTTWVCWTHNNQNLDFFFFRDTIPAKNDLHSEDVVL